jgi:hypothetical protein
MTSVVIHRDGNTDMTSVRTLKKASSIPLLGRRLDLVHRMGAAVLGVGLCVFGILGVANRLEFLSAQGKVLLGLGANGLLATISLIIGAVLVGAAFRGGRSSSTITVIIGVLFLLSGLLNLAVLDTGSTCWDSGCQM